MKLKLIYQINKKQKKKINSVHYNKMMGLQIHKKKRVYKKQKETKLSY